VSMEILAHPLNHNGVLFAVGWKPDFNLMSTAVGEQEQYLVFEFIHSSVRIISAFIAQSDKNVLEGDNQRGYIYKAVTTV